MIPQSLQDVEKYLRESTIRLVTGGDARTNSSQSEQAVVQLIQNANQWQVYSPHLDAGHNRHWYDVRIDDYYVDVKVSGFAGNDNTNAKKAIYYLLTGKDPGCVDDAAAVFFEQMRKNENKDEVRDYYYLVVNKSDVKDVFFVSLKGLAHAAAAPNNPPFQTNWNICRESQTRTWDEARDFLLGKWAASIERNIANINKRVCQILTQSSF